MVFNVFVTALWMSEIESKRRPFKWNFTFWWGNKSNQQVLNLTNTEGGWAQSLFVGLKTAWRLSRVKIMLVIFFDLQGVIHKEFVPEGETMNAVYYNVVMERLLNRIRRVRPGMCKSGNWFLLHDNAPSHNAMYVCAGFIILPWTRFSFFKYCEKKSWVVLGCVINRSITEANIKVCACKLLFAVSKFSNIWRNQTFTLQVLTLLT